MTPAEEVRAAATTLRCVHSFSTLPPHGTLMRPGDCPKCGISYDDHGNVPISDRLREPLAEWMEAVAGGWERADAAGLGKSAGRRTSHPALALARVINGGAS